MACSKKGSLSCIDKSAKTEGKKHSEECEKENSSPFPGAFSGVCSGFAIKMREYTLRAKATDEVLLKSITCKIPKGKLTLLIGDSQERRETLLNVLSGQPMPGHGKERGRIKVQNAFGELERRDAAAWMKRTNYSRPASPQMYDAMTPREVLMFVATVRERPKSAVDEALHFTGLAPIADVQIQHLAEEMDSVLDVVMLGAGMLTENEVNTWNIKETRNPCFFDDEKLLQRIRENKKTNILVLERDLPESILALADWIVFMHKSAVVYCGPCAKMEKHLRRRGMAFSKKPFSDFILGANTGRLQDILGREDRKVLESFLEGTGRVRHWSSCTPTKSVFVRPDRFNFSTVKALMKRSALLERRFRFPVFLARVLIYCAVCALSVGLIFFSWETLDFTDIHSSPIVTKSAEIPKFPRRVPEFGNFPALKEGISALIRAARTVRWSISACFLFWYYMIFLYFASVCISPCALHSASVEMCKLEIRSGMYNAAEFIAALVLEILVKNILVPCILQAVCFCTTNYFITRETAFMGLISYTYFDYFVAFLCSNFVFGMYVVLIHLISFKALFSRVNTCALVLVPLAALGVEAILFPMRRTEVAVDARLHGVWRILFNNMRNEKNVLERKYAKEMTALLKRPYLLYAFKRFRMRDFLVRPISWFSFRNMPEWGAFFGAIVSIAGDCTHCLYRYGPSVVFDEVLYKIGYYREYFSMGGSEALTCTNNSLAEKISEEIQERNKIPGLFMHFYPLIYCTDPGSSTLSFASFTKTGFFGILFTIIRCSLLPGLLLCVFLLLSYTSMQPG
ncbi:uncharacterized protein NEMAJ01_0610 [Nematocida major]|uniref:uncharacterized protein n=1 Tax=Nematocida major TaxID=1912982 RepID=UPI0020089225|nr:uncharacterized protein NEMAJ01_0610 [Nematocida major]KAH9385714.1 hypothetical protein NEMAJ01_0610 [Nematocida major]